MTLSLPISGFCPDGVFEPNATPRETNPRWQDMDNDSLSDGLEIGGWNISVYFEATGEKKRGYPIVVTSCPWTIDTDSDGLTDGQEFENATHPNGTDTDGDGMTDLWELTGPAPSDPCGIEGTPPNLSDLHVKTEEEWEWQMRGVGLASIPMYVRTRNEINVTVTATDNVGLKWIRFHIDDKGEQKARFAQNTNNSTVTVFFKHDLWSKWVAGYDLNITISDVNGNEGYLEFHIDSALEAFVQWLIGQVTALAKFVMELASAAIEWVWNFVESIMTDVFSPVIEKCQGYVLGIASSVNLAIIDHLSNGELSDESQTELETQVITPFVWTLIGMFVVLDLIISITAYFAPMISNLITGILLLALGILILIVLSDTLSNDDAKNSNIQSEEYDMSAGSFTSILGKMIMGDYGSRSSPSIGVAVVAVITFILTLYLTNILGKFMNKLNIPGFKGSLAYGCVMVVIGLCILAFGDLTTLILGVHFKYIYLIGAIVNVVGFVMSFVLLFGDIKLLNQAIDKIDDAMIKPMRRNTPIGYLIGTVVVGLFNFLLAYGNWHTYKNL